MMPGRLQAIEATDPRRVSASRTLCALKVKRHVRIHLHDISVHVCTSRSKRRRYFLFPASRTVSAAARSELSGLLLLSAKRVVDVPGRAQRMLASVEFDAAFMTVATLCAAISSSTDRRLA